MNCCRICQSEKLLAQARDAIQWLVDFQNGPPLPAYEKCWTIAMKKCDQFMKDYAEYVEYKE